MRRPLVLYPNGYGGGGGGGAPEILRSVGDLSSGYTFTDTASLQTSYAYDSGTDIHSFELATIGVGAETNSFLSGSNFTGPKYHIGLTYADGTAVLAGDRFSFTVVVDSPNIGLTRSYCVGLGVCQTPSSTVLGTMRASGLFAISSAAGVPGFGGFEENFSAAASVASMTSAIGSANFAGAPLKYRNGSSFGVMSAVSGNVNTRAGGGTWNVADGNQLGLAVMVGSNGTVTTTGGTFSLRLRYIVAKTN